jgi:hypothetical protein
MHHVFEPRPVPTLQYLARPTGVIRRDDSSILAWVSVASTLARGQMEVGRHGLARRSLRARPPWDLLSITHLMDCGADIQFVGKGCTISDEHGEIICEGRRQEGRYIMDMLALSPASARITVAE